MSPLSRLRSGLTGQMELGQTAGTYMYTIVCALLWEAMRYEVFDCAWLQHALTLDCDDINTHLEKLEGEKILKSLDGGWRPRWPLANLPQPPHASSLQPPAVLA